MTPALDRNLPTAFGSRIRQALVSLTVPETIALLGIAAGIAIRLTLYLLHAPLWFDEVAIALNIAGRDYRRLLEPLWIQQSAPVLYLWIERSFVTLFGVNEFSLRALPLLCGIGFLFLMRRLTGMLSSPRVTALAVLFAAFSHYLARYSNEVKPYEVDAFVTVVLVILASHFLLSGAHTWRKDLLLFSAGCLAPWLSTPSIFVLAAIAAAFLVERLERQQKARSILFIFGFGLVSIASFAIAYKFYYGPVSASPFMRIFWAPFLINSSWPVQRIVMACLDTTIEPAVGLYGTHLKLLLLIAFPLLIAGAWALWVHHGRPLFVLFVLPLLCTYGAACAGLWVLAARLMMFTIPLTILIVSLGVEQLSAFFPAPRRNLCFWCIGAIALVFPIRFVLWDFTQVERHGNRELVANTLRSVRPGDTIYVYSRAAAAWMFYGTHWQDADRASIDQGIQDIERLGPNSGNSRPRGRAVSNEGFSWLYRRNNHTELLGVATGTYRDANPKQENHPDPGWAENEMARIRATGSRRVWVVASEYHVEPLEMLLRRLKEGGFSCSDFFVTRDTRALTCDAPTPSKLLNATSRQAIIER